MDKTQRKKQLIAQGALHRAHIVLARQETRAALRPQALARGTLGPIAGVALTLLGRRAGSLLPGARAWMPLLLTALPALAKRRRLWKVAAAAGGAAALGLWLARRRKSADARH
jgi:hypothetical protein